MMILVLLYVVHLQHIIQVLLMMNLILFERKVKKYDLLMVIMIELFKVVLLGHKIHQNL